MNRAEMTQVVARLLANRGSAGEIVDALLGGDAGAPKTAALEDASLDLDRSRRCGFPEVVFGEGKSVETLSRIVRRLAEANADVMVTRVAVEKAAALLREFRSSRYNELARVFRLPKSDSKTEDPHPGPLPEGEGGRRRGIVAVVTAGSSDRPVAEEARETLDWMGVETRLVQDVGVAGPHRLPERLAELADADAVVVVAGMEGALPSVVGGYVACPVIGVPTSIGYGANFGGLAALLSMLNSCAANVTVVNIDAGFKAGYVAGLIATGKSATRRD